MRGKAQCRLCGDKVLMALKHLKDKHPEIYESESATAKEMWELMDKYFVQ